MFIQYSFEKLTLFRIRKTSPKVRFVIKLNWVVITVSVTTDGHQRLPHVTPEPSTSLEASLKKGEKRVRIRPISGKGLMANNISTLRVESHHNDSIDMVSPQYVSKCVS